MVTYDYYRIFYYAALFKSFSKAAEVLTSNQPNIARTITRLESELIFGEKVGNTVQNQRKLLTTPGIF